MASKGAFSEFLQEYLISEMKKEHESDSEDDSESIAEALDELGKVDAAAKERLSRQFSQVIPSLFSAIARTSVEGKVAKASHQTARRNWVAIGVHTHTSLTTASSHRKKSKVKRIQFLLSINFDSSIFSDTHCSKEPYSNRESSHRQSWLESVWSLHFIDWCNPVPYLCAHLHQVTKCSLS